MWINAGQECSSTGEMMRRFDQHGFRKIATLVEHNMRAITLSLIAPTLIGVAD